MTMTSAPPPAALVVALTREALAGPDVAGSPIHPEPADTFPRCRDVSPEQALWRAAAAHPS